MKDKVYIAIDLKSFYASVECVERSLNPLTTNLVVADEGRTSKTICLAVSPSLKQYGLSGRSRLYEVETKIKDVNKERRKKINYKDFTSKSHNDIELKMNPYLELDYIIAKPRMALYMEYSTKIYNIYLKYIASEDIHAYSIDEVFIDATSYLKLYKLTPYELTMKIIKNILEETGITATAGIAPNLFLCKVAMDIVAKHLPGNKDGVRIASLDIQRFRKLLWNHQPLTDFWRIGPGIAKRLIDNKMYTLGDVAKTSIKNEELLYKLFGVNAELIIDHAWGLETCTIKDIKKYKPRMNSISTSQVLHTPYDYKNARIVALEMTDSLVLDLVSKGLVLKRIDLIINYDTENINEDYKGNIVCDRYGRSMPKESHGYYTFDRYLSSTKLIVEEMNNIYNKIVNKNLTIRRITIAFNDVVDVLVGIEKRKSKQLDLFSDNENIVKQDYKLDKYLENERNIQKAIIKIRNKYGKNAMLKGIDYEKKATARDRNNQIGGHAS